MKEQFEQKESALIGAHMETLEKLKKEYQIRIQEIQGSFSLADIEKERQESAVKVYGGRDGLTLHRPNSWNRKRTTSKNN